MLQLQLYIKTPATIILEDEVTSDSENFLADNGTSMNLLEGVSETIERDTFERVEMFKDESVTLTQSIQDVKDISKIFSDYSQTFNVPASKHNNKLFKHFYNYFIDGFDARNKKDSKIELNYKPFKTGKIKLEGATIKNNKPYAYKLTFYGATVNLKDLLGDIKLKGLTYFVTSKFTYSASLVKTYLQTAQDVSVAGVRWKDSMLFPLITHTDRLYYNRDVDTANADGLANLYYKLNGNTAQGLNYLQLKPAIRVMMLFSAIEHQFPEIKFGDDFLNDSNVDIYNLFMWLNIQEGDLIQSANITYNYFSNFTNIWKSNKAERKSGQIADVFSSGSFYIYQGRKTKTLDASFGSSANGEYSVVLRREGELVFEEEGLTGTSSPIIGLALQPGSHTIEIGGTTTADFTGDFKITALYSGRDAVVSWSGTSSSQATQQVWIKDQLPDIKILEFLTGIFKMFNLTAYVDTDGITQIRTLDSYYAGTTELPIRYYDITKYTDTKRSQVNTTIPFNQIEFEYEDRKNFFAADHEERFGVGWGSLKFKDSSFDGKKYNIKLPFSHFKFNKLVDQGYNNSSTTIMWGWGADKEKSPSVGKPLLFYPIQANSTSVGQSPTTISYIGASGHETLGNYFLPSNSSSLNTSNNINFGAEINEFSNRPFTETLFNDHYKTYVQDIFKIERRLTKLDAYIPMSIITDLKLYDRIVIGDRVYKINKISTNFNTLKSQLELINVFDEREEVLNILEAVSTVDLEIKVKGTTADSSVVTVDAGIEYAVIEEDPIKEVPGVPANYTEPINNEECAVTAATLSHPTQETNSNSGVIFAHSIASMGKICEVSTLESYGFIYADTSAALVGTDLDTLIATGGITTRKNAPISNLSPSNIKTYYNKLTGLSQGDIKYWRFFARTNTTSDYKTADIISGIYSATAEATVSYTQTATIVGYSVPNSTRWDGNIRTIRIMDAAGNLVDYKGILFGHWNFYSKIVPYIVEGNDCDFGTGSGSGYPFFGLDGALGGGPLFYHATDLQIAKNAAKSYEVGDTGATFIPVMTYENRYAEDDKNTHPLGKTGISLHASTRNSNALLADGFYASFAGSIFEVDGLYVPDFTPYVGTRADSPNSGMARGVSVQIVNGYITNRVTYKTKND